MVAGKSDLVDIELVYVRDTEKAFMVKNPNGRKRQKDGKLDDALFLPKSLVERDGHIFTMPMWLAVDKGIDNLAKE